MKAWLKRLQRMGSCREALEWCQGYDSPQAAWAACDRGDWMLWYAGMMSGPPSSDSRRKLVGAVADCLHVAVPYAGSSRKLVTTVSYLCQEYSLRASDISLSDLHDATEDATETATNVSLTYAAYAAHAALRTAYDDAAEHARYTAYAASQAAYEHAILTEDTAWAYATAQRRVLEQCADIMHRHYPTPPEAIQ